MSRVQPARAYDALYGAWGTRATPSRPTRATPRAPRGRFDRPSLTSSSTQRRIFADPVYTVSGARDHYREQARATNATETVPVRENMFAEGANYPAHETRCVRAPSPERPLPSIAAPAKSLSRPYLAHEKRKTKNASRRSTSFCSRSSSRRHRMRTRDSLAPGAHVSRAFRPETTAGATGAFGGAATAASTSFASGTRDDSFASAGGSRGPSRFRRPVAQRPVERAVDRPAHAPRTAAPYEAVDSTVMARAVPRRRIAPPKSRAAGTQSDYRESEAQTAPYAPEAFLPTRPSTRQRALNALHHVPGTNGEPEVLTLRDPNYDAGAPLGAADVDRVERARAKRAFEASLPPLSDTAALPLRRRLMEEWEEAEWAEREREIARVQEERLAVLKAAIDAREAEAESVAEQRLARMRRGAMREKGRKFDAVQTKRVRGLRKLELRRMGAREASAMAAEGPVSASAGRTVAEYASYASGTYAPLTREGRVFEPAGPGPSGADPQRFAFDDDRRRSALDEFLELEESIPTGALDAERTVRAAERAELRMTGRLGPPKLSGDAKASTNTSIPTLTLRPEERREAMYFEQLDRTAAALARSKAGAGGERGSGAIWPAPLRDESLEEKTLEARAAREAARATKLDDGPQRVERPETPELEPPLDEMAPEFRAVVTLQRLLRGVAARNEASLGLERRRELIAELRADEREADETDVTDETVSLPEEEDAFGNDAFVARARSNEGEEADSSGERLDSDGSDSESSAISSYSDADAELTASVARATARALAVLAIPDADARAAAFAATEAAAARADAERELRGGAATAIQAAHRGRAERRRLVLERDAREREEREKTASLTEPVQTEREAFGTRHDVSDEPEISDSRIDVDALSSSDVASVTRLQRAAKRWTEREVRLDFLLAEAEAAAAEIPAAAAADPHVARLQRSARAHVEAVAETRALARAAGATEAQAAAALAGAEPSEVAARLSAADASAAGESSAGEDLALSPSARAMQTAARRYLEEALGASARVRLDELPPEDAEKVRRLQASAKKLVGRQGTETEASKTEASKTEASKTEASKSLAGAFDDAAAYDHARVARCQAVARGRAARREAAARRDALRAREANTDCSYVTNETNETKQRASPNVVVDVDADFADAAEALVGTPAEQEAAVLIQAAHRGAEGRRRAREARRRRDDPEYRAALEAAEAERAAIAMQAARRGSVARRSVAEMRMRLQAEADERAEEPRAHADGV